MMDDSKKPEQMNNRELQDKMNEIDAEIIQFQKGIDYHNEKINELMGEITAARKLHFEYLKHYTV